MSFHGAIYIICAKGFKIFDDPFFIGPVFIILSVLILSLSAWTFLISQRFQKPILFDRKTEEERKDSIEKLTMAVEKQTEKLDNIIEIFRSKEKENNQESELNGETSNGSKNR